MVYMKKIIITLAGILLTGQCFSQNEADIIGLWVPKKGDSHIRIEKIGNKYFGKVVWLEKPNDPDTGKPETDDKNPDEALRNQPVLGLRVLKDFVYEGKGVFKSGTAYDPNNGKTYCGKITIIDTDHIDMRGSICGFSILGRTETWTRVKK